MAQRKSYSKDDSVWRAMKRRLRSQRSAVSLGWFEGQNYGAENNYLPMAQVAQWVEEGHANGGRFAGTTTPPRPAIRLYFMPSLQASTDLMEMSVPLIHKVAMGQMTWKQLHEKIAPKLLYRFRLALETISSPANSPVTIALKGHDKPWVETGVLISAVRFKIDSVVKR